MYELVAQIEEDNNTVQQIEYCVDMGEISRQVREKIN